MAIEHPPPVSAAAASNGWVLRRDGFDPHIERGVEGAFSVANGRFGVRAAVEEGSAASNPMVLVAGVYVPTTAPAGQTLLTIHDPSLLTLLIDGEKIQLALVDTVEHWREIDLRAGEMRRTWSFEDRQGRRWRLESLRAASAAASELYLHRLSLHLEAGEPADVALQFDHDMAAGAATRGADPSMPHLVTTTDVPGFSPIRTQRDVRCDCDVREGGLAARITQSSPLVVESLTNVSPEGGPPRAEAVEAERFGRAREAHGQVWSSRWAGCDVAVEGDDDLQQAVRFALYHLLSASAVNDGRTSVGARNLSGEAYHGHIFWDTEIFVLPVLSLTRPAAARSALLYRFRTLDAARSRARSLGYRGALYAWESTDTGDDRTPSSALLPDGTMLRILNGELEHHISAAIPYGVVQYWQATGDDVFMREHGLEMLFECARFWASRVTPSNDEYSIRKVIGPDEYHIGVDNDAYTNAMASWTLRTAAALAEGVQLGDAATRSVLQKLSIAAEEADEWRKVGSRLTRFAFTEDRVYERFDGFFGLEEVDVASFRAAGIPIDMAIGADAVQRSRASKQADVLMTAALLPESWSEASLARNFAYYEPYCAHGSSLSPPVHALLAAWLRDGDRCRAYLEQTMAIDLGDGFRGAAGGVHLAALGGLWQATIFGLAGFKFTRERIAFDPYLPDGMQRLAFTLQWQGRRLQVRIEGRELAMSVDGPPCVVRVNQREETVEQGRPMTFAFDPGRTFWSSTHTEGPA